VIWGQTVSELKPYFCDATPTVKNVMRFFVGSNLALIVFCAGYLALNLAASGPAWPYTLVASPVGYFIADFLSGTIHCAMDTWVNEQVLGRAVAIARDHHTHPQNILGYTFLDYASLGATPSALVVGPAVIVTVLFPITAVTGFIFVVWFVVSACLLFGTNFHNSCHRPPTRLAALAQKRHLTVPPRQHWMHHRNQTIHYYVINGWANYICHQFIVWRGLEWTISRLTGAQPRSDDLAWQRRYEDTGTLLKTQK
jgi:hypothetical protein